MTDYAKVEALHRRLLGERKSNVEAMAESGALPPTGRMAYLADLDATISAVEVMLQERTGLAATTADMVD